MAAVTTVGSGLGRRRRLILGTIGLAQLMVVLDLTVMNIALPSARRTLHFTAADRQWVVTAPAGPAAGGGRWCQKTRMRRQGNRFLKSSGSFGASGRIRCAIGPPFLPGALILPGNQHPQDHEAARIGDLRGSGVS